MELILNGKPVDRPEGTTLADLVASCGLAAGACAAEVNKRLIPRRDHAATVLKPGDQVELVTLVGGGA
ncbi:MAG: sulfur carrier protein ThiS [Phycisphaerales bacterium]|nr:sulfur carrier protein ThiS [Phycisphaerales bacterium]